MTQAIDETETTGVRLRLVSPDDPPPQIPPHDLESEAAVCSAAILDPAALPRIVDFLRAEHFHVEPHRRIFEACVALFAERRAIDVVTVATWLRERARLEQVGGMPYLTGVLEGSPCVGNVRDHAIAIHGAWRVRQVLAACHHATALGYHGAGDPQRYVDALTRALAKLGAQNPVRPVEDNAGALKRILGELAGSGNVDDPGKVKATGYPTGLHSLDAIIGGLAPAHKTTVVATTGVGKTTLGLQLAIAFAKNRVGVLYFSLEMRREELLRRALSSESGVSASRVKARDVSPDEYSRILAAAERVRTLPLRIEDTPKLTIEQLKATALAYAERSLLIDHVPLGLVVVDYIQRLDVSPGFGMKERRHQIGHSTREFKIMCQELGVAGLELAQGKDPDRNAGKRARPTANGAVFESSEVAKEADELIVLIPEDDDPRSRVQEISACVIKQRDGRKGECTLNFVRDIYRFEDPNDPGRCASRDYIDGSY